MTEAFAAPAGAATTVAEAIARSLAVEAAEGSVEVDGAAIRYRRWDGPPGATPVLLAHGVLAHRRWWDPIAAWLSRDHPVAALDFSGMGDSGRRRRYDRNLHALEIAEVARALGFRRAVLAAHSYGGDPAIRCCSRFPDLFSRLILLDCRLVLPGVTRTHRSLKNQTYPTAEAARERFRLWPESPLADPTLLDHVIDHSMERVEGGWTWKFDADMELGADPKDPLDVTRLAIPTVFVRGEESVVTTPEQMAVTRAHLPHALHLSIPAAGHHLLLDQPVALTTLLRTLLA